MSGSALADMRPSKPPLGMLVRACTSPLGGDTVVGSSSDADDEADPIVRTGPAIG